MRVQFNSPDILNGVQLSTVTYGSFARDNNSNIYFSDELGGEWFKVSPTGKIEEFSGSFETVVVVLPKGSKLSFISER